MIDHLAEEYELSRADAYVLSSLCVDLRISEVVDAGAVHRERAASAGGVHLTSG